MTEYIEQNSEALAHDPEEARWVWEEAARVYRLHGELASLYRVGSRDRRTIHELWARIEEGEAALRLVGVTL